MCWSREWGERRGLWRMGSNHVTLKECFSLAPPGQVLRSAVEACQASIHYKCPSTAPLVSIRRKIAAYSTDGAPLREEIMD